MLQDLCEKAHVGRKNDLRTGVSWECVIIHSQYSVISLQNQNDMSTSVHGAIEPSNAYMLIIVFLLTERYAKSFSKFVLKS